MARGDILQKIDLHIYMYHIYDSVTVDVSIISDNRLLSCVKNT